MKLRMKIILTTLAILMVMTPIARSATPLEEWQEMAVSREKFTSFNLYDPVWHIHEGINEIIYFSGTGSDSDKFYVGIKIDGTLEDTFQIVESGFNRAYYVVNRVVPLNGSYYAYIDFMYWDGSMWWNKNLRGTYIDSNYDMSTIGDPPPSNQPESNYMDGNLVITQPPYNGYKVTSDRLELRYGYGIKPQLPKPGKPEISGVEVVPLSHTGTSTRYDSENDMQYSFFKATVILEPGLNTITVSIDYKGKVYQDSVIVEYLTGFVDEDGDGNDDRTGFPIDSDGSGLTPDGAPLLPDNPTIFDYVKYAVDSIIYVFAQVGIAIKGMVSSVGDIGKILTSFFSFMPQPFTGIIVVGLLIAIILRIFGR